MSSPLRLAMIVHFAQRSDDKEPFVDVDVQVWDGAHHVTTIKVLDLVSVEWPEDAPADTIESFAAIGARITAAAIAEEQFKRIGDVALHHIHDLEKETEP